MRYINLHFTLLYFIYCVYWMFVYSGVVQLLASLDREKQDVYELRVIAVDKAARSNDRPVAIPIYMYFSLVSFKYMCLVWRGGVLVGLRSRTNDSEAASSRPTSTAFEFSKLFSPMVLRPTQPFIPPRWVNRVPACLAGVKAGVFTCVG